MDADKEFGALHLASIESKNSTLAPPAATLGQAKQDQESEATIEAYIGAEMYSQRMFPYGCPSFQKAQVKLFKNDKGKQVLVDS